MTDDELEALREQTESGDRIDQAGADIERAALQETIEANLAEVNSGDRQKTVSVWDGEIAALVAALEADEHSDALQAIGEALRAEFDVSSTEAVDRSEVLRRALRLGLQQAAPSYMDTLREAVREHATQDL